MNGPDWDLYKSFAAVLREGSLSGAGRVLGLTQPSVARHIDALEAAVGTELFVRSQRGLIPTDRALALRPYADSLISTVAAMQRMASGGADEVVGTVRVTASEVVGIEHLPPILTRLRRAHPALAVELVLSNSVDDLLQRQADIAVRMVEPVQQALVARRVGAFTIGLHARQDYLERRGVPGCLADLAGHDLIGVDTETPMVRAVLRHLPGFDHAHLGLRTDSDVAQLAMIRAGFGIGVCQVALARRGADLTRVLPEAFSYELPIWIVMHEDLRTGARYRAVFDALADGLSQGPGLPDPDFEAGAR